MANSRLHQLSELGQSVWIDYLSRKLIHGGELARMIEEDAVVGVTSNPTIFQKAIAEGDAYDEQLREVLAEEDDPKEVFLKLAIKDVQDACDLLPAGLGRRRRPGRLRLDRGRPEPRLRHRGDDRPGATAARARRPAELLREDPGDRAGAAGDRGDDRPRAQHQRDADLLARALRGGRRSLPARARAARRERRRPRARRICRELLRLARGHRGRQAAGRPRRPGRAEGQARDRQRQARLPALQGAPRG